MSDLIDRWNAINVLEILADKMSDGGKTVMAQAVAVLKDLQSEEPERKKGEWLHKPNEYDDDTYECSRCSEPWTLIVGTPKENNMNFCPNCGADMRGE